MKGRVLFLLGGLVGTAGSPLAAQRVRLEGGLSVASGSYVFEPRTTTWALATGLALESGRLTVRASLPLYLQNTSLVSGSGIGRIPTGGSSSHAVDQDGRGGGSHGSHTPVEVPGSAVTGYEAAVGDPVIGLGWRVLNAPRTLVTLGAAIKAPVADTSTFGTGEWDAGARVSASRFLGRRGFVGVDLAYWRLGDMQDLDLRDPVSGMLTLGYFGEGGWGGSVVGSAATSVVEGFDGPVSVGAALTRVASGTSWSLLALAGVTETAADLAVGLSWSLRLSH